VPLADAIAVDRRADVHHDIIHRMHTAESGWP
jgi:hypothetical protein